MPDSTSAQRATISIEKTQRTYTRFVLLVAGLGGLLYGVDVGIIGGALPYLEATARLSAGQLSVIVAAVLMGSVTSTLFAGLLADWMGRKPLMLVSGLAFVVSIPVIATSYPRLDPGVDFRVYDRAHENDLGICWRLPGNGAVRARVAARDAAGRVA